MENINSIYVLNEIFSYIMNTNFKYKLFAHSKLFQQKLGMQLYEYQERFMNKFNMEMSTYLNFQAISNKDFDKNILKKKLENDISINKLDIKIVESCIINYLNNVAYKIKKNNTIIDKELALDIYSPFFEIISKTELFELKFTIPINADLIKKNNLKGDYISAFENLNASNIKYSSIYFQFKSGDDINYLAEFKIDFKRIKRLTIVLDYENYFSWNKFLETLFSFDNLCTNLVYFEFKNILLYKLDYIELNSIKNINNCELLEQLSLDYFKFKEPFILELKNLKKLNLRCCENISFKEDGFSSLESLIIIGSHIAKSESLIKLPKLEHFFLKTSKDIKPELIFDFLSAKNIKYIETNAEIFINFESNLLENVDIYFEVNDIFMEKKILEKLISLKNLKRFNIELNQISNKEILDVYGDNFSVLEAKIKWTNRINDCILYNFQNKFKNLSYLSLIQINIGYPEISLEISENKNCKVNKLKLYLTKGIIKLNCISFENLIKLKINSENKIKDLKNVFPIFNDNCKVVFHSLKTFYFICNYDISLDIMKNIHKNLIKMPKLKKLSLKFIITDLKEDYYKTFVRAILLLKLKIALIEIKKGILEKDNEDEKNYQEKEIKEICPDIDFNYGFEKIYILKFKKDMTKNDKELDEENNNKGEEK